jgi:hypothetical protein
VPLALVLLVALAVRVWGLGFGLPYAYARPDESAIAGPASEFLSGNLAPATFFYPTLFPYAVADVYVLYFLIAGRAAGYRTLASFAASRAASIAPFFDLSRALSAIMGTLTAWWVYGTRVFDRTVGLVGAAFCALAFLHVRDSSGKPEDVGARAMTGCTAASGATRVAWTPPSPAADGRRFYGRGPASSGGRHST